MEIKKGPRFSKGTIIPEVPEGMELVKFHGKPALIPTKEKGEPILGDPESGFTIRQFDALVKLEEERRRTERIRELLRDAETRLPEDPIGRVRTIVGVRPDGDLAARGRYILTEYLEANAVKYTLVHDAMGIPLVRGVSFVNGDIRETKGFREGAEIETALRLFIDCPRYLQVVTK